ncbi:MAG: twin-arginine translocase subunit TatB [Betaproteobacteria bacterium]|nr:twin-arginine translocase subunit TatB [Betaproteobacteria bacterium]
MLDIGFSELLLIAGVGLIVLGPKRLPVVTRTVGTLLGRAQRYVADVKGDIQRQMELEELRKVQQSVSDLGASIEKTVSGLEAEAQALGSEVSSGLDDFSSVYDKKSGLFIGAPARSWTQEQADLRVRDRVRARLRRRFLVKRPRDL